jgi:hypothetical protein
MIEEHQKIKPNILESVTKAMLIPNKKKSHFNKKLKATT